VEEGMMDCTGRSIKDSKPGKVALTLSGIWFKRFTDKGISVSRWRLAPAESATSFEYEDSIKFARWEVGINAGLDKGTVLTG
jgi:hypothetical protein